MGILIIFLAKCMGWLFYALPLPLKKVWIRGLALILRVKGVRAKVVRQNLQLAYPDQPDMQGTLFKQAYLHLANLTLEMFMLFGPLPRFARKQVTLHGIENWRAARSLDRGVIFLSSHVGNWEIMAATGALQFGIDILLVTKKLKPTWLHVAIAAARKRCGVLATYEPKTFRDVLSHLRKNGTVGFVLDQYAGPPVGVRVPVFGVPVGTSNAVAILAKRTGAVVLPVKNYLNDSHQRIVEIGEAIVWEDASELHLEVALNTARFASRLEKDIKQHPGQWLWIHRRFKGDLSPLRHGEWQSPRNRK